MPYQDVLIPFALLSVVSSMYVQVDLKCTVSAAGYYYYSEHLPVLGKFRETACRLWFT